MNYPIQIGTVVIDSPTALIAMILAIESKYQSLSIKYDALIIDVATHELRLKAIDDIIAQHQTLLAKLQVEKADKTDIPEVEDLLTGKDTSVPNIKSVMAEFKKVLDKTILSGDTSPLKDISSCMLKPTPSKVLSFSLDKGTYAFDGVIHHHGEQDARGELYFEIGSVTVDKSITTFSGIGNAPIVSLIEITADNTEVKLMAKRVSGLKLDIISNQRVRSYCRFLRVS